MPTSTGVALPKTAFTHWFTPYPTKLNNRVNGSANGSAGSTTTFGYVIPATSGGDGYYLNDYCDPADPTNSYNTVGGLLRNCPPLSRVMAYSSATNTVPVGPAGATWSGKTSPQWRIDDFVQEVADMIAAGFDGATLEMLMLNLATSVPSFYSFAGGTGDQWDRQVIACQAVDTYNAAKGTTFKVMPMPDISTLTTTVSNVVNAVRTVAQFACVQRVTDAGVSKVVIAPYRPEVQPASFWVSVRDSLAAAGTPVVMIPTFVNAADSAGGLAAWISAGIAWGHSTWGNRNPQANAVGSTNSAMATAASLPSGIWMQAVSLQDSRPRTKVFQECLGWGNLLASWALAAAGAYWVQGTTWNDWSEHSGMAPSVALGAIPVGDVASLGVPDTGYGAMISVPALLARRYMRRWRDGSPLPTDNTMWVAHRRHSYTAVPTWAGNGTVAGYTITAMSNSTEIGSDTRMWRDLTRVQTGSTWTYNANAGGSQPAANIVDVLTFFDADTQVSVTVGGTQIGTTQTATAGEWRYSFPTGGAVGDVVVTATRAGSSPVVHTSPTTITAAPVVQDMQYYPSFTKATFSTTGTGIRIESPTNHHGNLVRAIADAVADTDAVNLRTVNGLIAAAVATVTSAPADVQIFTTTGTWTKPTGAKSVHVALVAGGGGGGSGRRGAAGSIRAGGAGGGAGGFTQVTMPASALGATETVTVALGGSGGASKTTNDTNGSAGTNGGTSSFGTWIKATGGVAGGGGTTTGSAAGSGATSWPNTSGYNGGSGTAGDATGLVGPSASSTLWAPGGGAAGGGITTADVAAAGGVGAAVGSSSSGGLGQVLAGGTSGAVGAAGGNGSGAASDLAAGGSGGGGGGASTAGNAGAGGNGGNYGSGGGGGGASVNSVGNSGAGGNGAGGIVVVTTWR